MENLLPERLNGKCVCEFCEGNYIQVDPVGCGCTECVVGEYRPARDEYDYDVHNGVAGTQESVFPVGAVFYTEIRKIQEAQRAVYREMV